jgi:hypothetical protein
MQRPLVIAAFAQPFPTGVAAQSDQTFPCTNGGLTRRVEIAYAGAGDLPCEVRYFKEGDARRRMCCGAPTRRRGIARRRPATSSRSFKGSVGFARIPAERRRRPAAATSRSGDDDTDVLGAGTKR